MTAAEIRRPSLDDVFLALTGQRAAPSMGNGDHAPAPGRWAHPRALMLGEPAGDAVVRSAAWIAALLLVFVPLAVCAYQRR